MRNSRSNITDSVREELEFNKVLDLLENFALSSENKNRIRSLSILHNPKVLILDEPTTGLDPNQLVEIRALIKELGKDKTVLFSTHIMQEVEAVCDRVLIIKKGKIMIDKKLSELQENKQQTIDVTFDNKIQEQWINKLPNVVSYKNNYDNNWCITFESEEDMRPKVFDFSQENGLKILGLNTQNKTLETLFREITA